MKDCEIIMYILAIEKSDDIFYFKVVGKNIFFPHHSGEQDVFIVISNVNQLEQVITDGLQLVPLNLSDSFYCGIRSNRLSLTITSYQ